MSRPQNSCVVQLSCKSTKVSVDYDRKYTYFAVELTTFDGVKKLKFLCFKVSDAINWLLDTKPFLLTFTMSALSQLCQTLV